MVVFSQRKIEYLLNHPDFNWTLDTLENRIFIYTESDSTVDKRPLFKGIARHLQHTRDFIGIAHYQHEIHYFVLPSRDRLSLLLGYETNGTANDKENYVAGIYSEGINSVFSNHELFHLMAMKTWGDTDLWPNEGMAVYSDGYWWSYKLHELAKFLIDNGKQIPLTAMVRRLRKQDPMITYPLLGSFTMFIDETYGRNSILEIWNKGYRNIKAATGKNLEDLELEWYKYLENVRYQEIHYPLN